MQLVPVTIRSDDDKVPPCETQGYAPDDSSPLCVTKHTFYNFATAAWELQDGWRLTHRPTGFSFGDVHAVLGPALALLAKCDPTFPAWPLATLTPGCPALAACKVKYEWAITTESAT